MDIEKNTIFKTVAMPEENDQLMEICSRIEQRSKFLDKKINDIYRHIEELIKQKDLSNSTDWKELEQWLASNNRLPSNYHPATHRISFSIKNNDIRVTNRYNNQNRE